MKESQYTSPSSEKEIKSKHKSQEIKGLQLNRFRLIDKD